MTQIMTAAQMTDGQIENAVGKLRDAMRKHRSEITSEIAQQVLGTENLGMMMFTPFREQAEAIGGFIVRRTKVNRKRNPQEALDATDHVQYTDRKIVDAMPGGEGDEVEVCFFKPEVLEYDSSGSMSDDNLEKAMQRRYLKKDPIAVITFNEKNPSFANENPHVAHWKDEEGNWCYVAFNRDGEVIVNRNDRKWHYNWYYAGVRIKPTTGV
jgi:hypothetical protein